LTRPCRDRHAAKAKYAAWCRIARGTEDSTIADIRRDERDADQDRLHVALGSNAKYNQLLRIEGELGSKPHIRVACFIVPIS